MKAVSAPRGTQVTEVLLKPTRLLLKQKVLVLASAACVAEDSLLVDRWHEHTHS
jgi:hypothetical protein